MPEIYGITATHPGTMSFTLGDNPPHVDVEVACELYSMITTFAGLFFNLVLTWIDPDTEEVWGFGLHAQVGGQPPLPGTPPPPIPYEFSTTMAWHKSSSGALLSVWESVPGSASGAIYYLQLPADPTQPWIGDWQVRADAPNIPSIDGSQDALTVQFASVSFTTLSSDVNVSPLPPNVVLRPRRSHRTDRK